jgi:predicted nucleic acid-binding protein
MGYLLDTNLISELRKEARCHPRVQAWRQSITHDETFLSVLTFGELRRGVEKLKRKDRATAAVLEEWLRGLELSFGRRILPVNLEIAQIWGKMSPLQPLPAADGLLAATAKYYGLRLATRNVADFQRSGVDFINPFDF